MQPLWLSQEAPQGEGLTPAWAGTLERNNRAPHPDQSGLHRHGLCRARPGGAWHGRDSHAPSPAAAGGLDYGRVHPRPCQPGAVRPRAGQARSEPAIRPPQQHRSPVSPARPGQLWRVWALVLGPLPALGPSLLLLSRQALGCSLTPGDNVPLPLHSSRAGGRAGLGGFVPVAERAGGHPLCPGAGARRAALERAHGGHWLPQDLQARRAALRRGQASVQQQIERLTEAYLAGVVGLDEFRRRRDGLDQKGQALDAQLRQLEAQVDRQTELARVGLSTEAFCRRVRAGLDQATWEQKRQLIEGLVARVVVRVVVTESQVEIRY